MCGGFHYYAANSSLVEDRNLDARIAQRIGARRSELRLSLDGLSEISGVSRAMISRIERAESSATAVLLAKLCNALGMTLSGLMADAERPPYAIAKRDAQVAWRDVEAGYVRRMVSPSATGSAIELVEVELPPGVRVVFDTPPAIPYEQHLLIVDGRLALTTGAERLELNAGDCIFMIVNGGVTFENRTTERVRYLVALSSDPRGEHHNSVRQG